MRSSNNAQSVPPLLQHRSQRDLWFNTSFVSPAASGPTLALDLSKAKSSDASESTHSSAGTISIVPVACKIVFASPDKFVQLGDEQSNRSVLNNLVSYLEEDSLGPQEKLRIVRCNQGFLTAFFSFLSSLHSETCVLLFLHLEMIKDFWAVLPPETLRNELLELKMMYVDANGPLFANISAIACQSFSDGLKSDRPSLRSLAFVEQEINEMVFGNLQNSRYFFEKLPDSHPLIQGQNLRDMPSIGRGLSSSRSKDQSASGRRATTMMTASEMPSSVAEGVFTDLDKLVWKSDVSAVFNVLVALRPLVDAEEFTLVSRHLLYVCCSFLKAIPLILHAASKETAKRDTTILNHTVESSTISLPMTVDLMTLYFCDDQAFGTGSAHFWSVFSESEEYKRLVELSVKRAAGGAEAKLNKKAVQLFPGLLERFYQSCAVMSSAFVWTLRAIEFYKNRASQAVLVLVIGEQLTRQKQHYLSVFRDVLLRLAERSAFFSSGETVFLNHFLGCARESWELFWDNIFPTQTTEFTARKTMDEHLSWIAVEAIRGTSSFTELEEKVLQVFKAQESALRPIPGFGELAASVLPQQSAEELKQSKAALKNESLSTQLAHVLAHRMREFEAFLSKSLSDEPLMFWIEASENQLSALSCRSLYLNYVAPNAKRQICFSRDASEAMRTCLETNPVQLALLDKALALLLAECSTILHQSALDFLSLPSEEVKAESPPPLVSVPSNLSTSPPQQAPSSPSVRKKLGSSAMNVLLPFKSRRKQLDEVAKMDPEEKLTWLLKRHRSELTEFLESNLDNAEKKAMATYIVCFDATSGRMNRSSAKETPAETMKTLLPQVAPAANLFIAHLMAKLKE